MSRPDGAGKWLLKTSQEAKPATGSTDARCVHCKSANALTVRKGEFVCRDARSCELRQAGVVRDHYDDPYDMDEER